MQMDSPAASPSVLGSPTRAKLNSPLRGAAGNTSSPLPATPGSDKHSPSPPKLPPTVINIIPQKVRRGGGAEGGVKITEKIVKQNEQSSHKLKIDRHVHFAGSEKSN